MSATFIPKLPTALKERFHGMPDDYAVKHYNGYVEAFLSLDEGYQRRVTRFLTQLKAAPNNHPAAKRLKGAYSDLWQFPVTKAHGGWRLIYRVDVDAREVLIEHLGPHPEWSRSRDGENL